jgi:hypothetical protein
LTLTPEKSGTLLLYPAPSYGGFMIYIANRLAREETDADKTEFIRGVVGLDKTHKGAKQAAVGFVAGYLLAKKLKKNG